MFYIVRATLDVNLDQWQNFDTAYEELSAWIKVNEAKVREEAELRPDLHSKQQQLSSLKVSSFL